MEDDFLNTIMMLQNGQAPQITPPQQVTMGTQVEERGQMPGITRKSFGYQSVDESADNAE